MSEKSLHAVQELRKRGFVIDQLWDGRDGSMWLDREYWRWFYREPVLQWVMICDYGYKIIYSVYSGTLSAPKKEYVRLNAMLSYIDKTYPL